jgi:hypothetical protein
MSSAQRVTVKKAFLYALIVSVVLSAILGILAILSGTWGEFQIRVLLTTIVISAASVCGLANGALLATKRRNVLPIAGIALALGGAAMLIGGIWTGVASQGYWKLAVSLGIFAVACGHLALLSMARLAQWFQWSLVTAYLVIFGVASLIVFLIITDFHGSGEGLFQLLAVAAIIDAAITVLIPVFHWLSRGQFALEGGSTAPEIAESSDQEIARLKERIVELERKKFTN